LVHVSSKNNNSSKQKKAHPEGNDLRPRPIKRKVIRRPITDGWEKSLRKKTQKGVLRTDSG